MIFFMLLFLSFFSHQNALAQAPTIIITKIAASLTSKQEWIEIYNSSKKEIDLTDWRFVEGYTESKIEGVRHKLKPVKGDMVLAPNEYAIIANSGEEYARMNPLTSHTIIDSSWGSLKEKGERVTLVDSSGTIIEDFIYPPTPEGIFELNVDSNSELIPEDTLKAHTEVIAEAEEEVHLTGKVLKVDSPSNSRSTVYKYLFSTLFAAAAAFLGIKVREWRK
jgi:hypothetical protein